MKNKWIIRIGASLFRLLMFLKIIRIPRGDPSHFLIVSTTGLGDTLWSLPPVSSLRRSFPKARIFVLTGFFGRELFSNPGEVDGIIEIPTSRGVKRLRELPRLLKQLKALKIGTVFFFHTQPTYALIAYLTGAVTYGNPDKVPPCTCTHPFPFTHPTEHLISHRLRMIQTVGAEAFYRSLYLETDSTLTETLCKRYRPLESPYWVGLCIGSQDDYKIWSEEQFGRLAKRLFDTFGASIALIGTRQEKHLAEGVRSYFPYALDLTGQFSVHELIHFIDGLDLLISNDTGPSHIAYAVATPCVTLFSPTNVEQNGPYYARGPARVVASPPTCTPCITTRCKIPLCMRQISVESVFKEVSELFYALDLFQN